MTNREMTLVYYHVPEDRDDPECPNVFGVPHAKSSLRLAHIHQVFPLKGSYLFRFKHNHEGNHVWLDLPELESKIPLYKDRVVMKATRVSWNESRLHSQYRQKKSPEGRPPKAQEFDFFEEEMEKSKPEKKFSSNGIDSVGLNPSKSEKVRKEEGLNLLDQNHGVSLPSSVGKKEEVNLLHSFEEKGGDLI